MNIYQNLPKWKTESAKLLNAENDTIDLLGITTMGAILSVFRLRSNRIGPGRYRK
jgi:hypothetical protein